MVTQQRALTHSIHSSTLADVLERVLDKGMVIAGDIKIKLVDIELLTIQIRLMIASVDKAKEMGIDWWTNNPSYSPQPKLGEGQSEVAELKKRIEDMEQRLSEKTAPAQTPAGLSGR